MSYQREKAIHTLKQVFGYESFRKGQEEVISGIMEGRDSLAIMPTGAGKSICYQLPALMMEGITLVISPLISLMQDQVKALNLAGVHAAYINSSLSERQVQLALDYASQGRYKLIYVAPERLETWNFRNFAVNAEISMLCVDESHCISQWGQDFRPSYLKIVDFIESLPKRPIISAFTATATTEVKDDIACILKLENPRLTLTGYNRENLYYRVEHVKDKLSFVLDYIAGSREESGIIYCNTRKNVDELHDILREKGLSVVRYHAGMETEDRRIAQEDFIYDRAKVCIATNAFGMGIDKSNVRYVLHYNMPQSMENYYQEAGRAGRDGEKSECILLFSPKDVITAKFLLEKKEFTDIAEEDIPLIQERDRRRLRIMEGYCQSRNCLRKYILHYFGEKGENCDNCGNCHKHFKELDVTVDAKKIIACIKELRERFGQELVVSVLRGARTARILERKLDSRYTYGSLRGAKERYIKDIIQELINENILYKTSDGYNVIKCVETGELPKDKKIIIRTIEGEEAKTNETKERMRKTDSLTSTGYLLFEELRKLRLEIAREIAAAPYLIFSDRTLIEMCEKTPMNRRQMMDVSGVGEMKFEAYGEAFLNCIRKFSEVHPNERTAIVVPNLSSTAYGATEGKRVNLRYGKAEFSIEKADVNQFMHQELMYISDIASELNRISSSEGVKKCSLNLLTEFLLKEGLIDETLENGRKIRLATELGEELGIMSIEKQSARGESYTLLRYPKSIQKMLLSHFVRK